MAKKQISAIKNGDVNIAEQIIKENYNSIYKYCYWKIGNSEDAQDITQEVFLSFVRNISTYSNQGKPRALLYTIAKNLCINLYKQRKPEYLDTTKEIIDCSASEELDWITDKLALEYLIRQLPQEQQEVIILRYGQELKLEEIAIIIGTTRFTVHYRLKIGLSTLKKKLNRRDFIEERFGKQLT